MTEIILTGDQIQRFVNATDGIVFCDPKGEVLGRIPAECSEEEEAIIREAKRRLASDQPRVPASEVLARLKSREQEYA